MGGELVRRSVPVERDFHGKTGLGTCATGVGLTPSYNAEHKNHFHIEITPEAGWMMIK